MQSELYKSIFAEGEQKGEQKGELKGLQKGLQEGFQQAISDLCEILGIEMTAERRAHIERLDLAGLAALRTHIKTARTWLPNS